MAKTSADERTILVDDASVALAQPLCARLARDGNRLFLVGSDEPSLIDLDASLCQAELHRYTLRSAENDASALADWISEQALSASGLLLLPDPRQPASHAALMRTFETCAAQLRAAKPPAKVVIVLARPAWSESWPAWEGTVTAAQFAQAEQQWRSVLAEWATALSPDQVSVNLVLAGPLADASFPERLKAAAEQTEQPAEALVATLAAHTPLGALISGAELAECVATLFSPFTQHLTGQTLQFGNCQFV